MKANYRIPFRRRREGKTDYRRRLKLLKSERPRVVVRSSLNNLTVQLIIYDPKGDQVLASATSKELTELKWDKPKSNTPCAYLTGLLAGKRAVDKGIKAGVLDLGLWAPSKGSKVFAAAKGVIDAGVSVPCKKDVIPKKDRIEGMHLTKNTPELFNEVKKEIEAGKWKKK
ncbi:MAG TPA: 50S ribosomal protein L18 [Thermoplasmata archaeon]|nr:50S ribosomal protein L18 [Thermoplasmata archaeon]HIH97858.1 50S ribosomal protein L18 [Thermoplasmata archaeon]